MMDFYDHPGFVRELLGTIAEYNISQVGRALAYDIDAVYFGDDWGAQHGLQMGPRLWGEFIQPVLRRMYGVVRRAGKFVMIHSCGDVDELFEELVNIGLSSFNPFQPEVMQVYELLGRYRGRLCFHGGLSTRSFCPTAARRRFAGNHGASWQPAAPAATSSPRPTTWKGTCRWPTCWPSSRPRASKSKLDSRIGRDLD
ncbi:MAG: hypothetical protein A2V99_02160 [Spirochaetes bacterium RBG_16_67_19]|nr:MAG: hypothetical protein A2V99_02160 [Spirochaetes bacterium RBG_16_67_19]